MHTQAGVEGPAADPLPSTSAASGEPHGAPGPPATTTQVVDPDNTAGPSSGPPPANPDTTQAAPPTPQEGGGGDGAPEAAGPSGTTGGENDGELMLKRLKEYIVEKGEAVSRGRGLL
jgi:hypothetical protein